MRHARGWIVTAAGLAACIGIFLIAGLTLMPVKTGSMRPTLQPGDLVIGVKPWLSAPAVGKVVVATPAFTEGGERMPPIAHRITGRAEKGTGWVTKGDFNPTADAWTVRPGDVQRVMVAHVPVRWVQSPVLIVTVIAALALAWLWPRRPLEVADNLQDEDALSSWPQFDPESWQAGPWARLHLRSAGLPYVSALITGQQRLQQATQSSTRDFVGHERVLIASHALWAMPDASFAAPPVDASMMPPMPVPWGAPAPSPATRGHAPSGS